MCGIAGVLHTDGRPASPALVARMADAVAHRGPDDAGSWVEGPVGLGHRRLAIIDLSPAGHQPMSNEDGTVWITYNGEIYNFRELRAELAASGHRFRSATDTEVLVHGYEQWGEGVLDRLNGMFAFGLWDARRRALLLARDRLGIKPLFYALLPDRLLFGSEVRALLADPTLDRTLDPQALACYLAMNYTPAPRTLLAAVRSLEPGHRLRWADGRLEDREYWDLDLEPRSRGTAEDLERFRDLLADAVRRQLVSDVPFGAFLSGGLDSSTVAYWMSRQLSAPLRTFSVRFAEAGYDEGRWARLASRAVGSDHHERVVSGGDAALALPEVVAHAEEPTADPSMVAVWHLAREARRHVAMVQTGDGADEMLAGYETYHAHFLRGLYRWLPERLRRGILRRLVLALPDNEAKVGWIEKAKRFVAAAELPPAEAHGAWRAIFDPEARARLLSGGALENGAAGDPGQPWRAWFDRAPLGHPLDRLLYVDLRLYLPSDMLVKVDRMTMAHGLEARVPFLDHRLVELAARLPPDLKLRHGWVKKYALKRIMRGRLPGPILRRRKAGFNLPTAAWLRGALRSMAGDLLSPSRVRRDGLFDPREVERLVDDHLSRRANRSHQLWCLLCLALWLDRMGGWRLP